MTIYAHSTGVDLKPAFDRLIDDLNRFAFSIETLPVFADDASASAGRVKVGQGYVTPDGFVKRRML